MERDKTRREFLRDLFFGGAALINTNLFPIEVIAGKYEEPSVGKWIKRENANFDIFPNKLEFIPGRKILVVSKKWQTAGLYDEYGNIVCHTTDKGEKIKFVFQVSTGREHEEGGNETEAGLYELVNNMGPDYKSLTYPKPNGGGPMPDAQFISKVFLNDKGKILSKVNKSGQPIHNGEAIHGSFLINSKSAKAIDSKGCIRMHIKIAEFLGKYFKNKTDNEIGDFVLVVEDGVPKVRNIKDLIE